MVIPMDFSYVNKQQPLLAERAVYAEKRKLTSGIYRTDDAWLTKGFFYASYASKPPRDAIGIADAVALVNQLKKHGTPDIKEGDLKKLVTDGHYPLPESWDAVLCWSRRVLTGAINDKKLAGSYQSVRISY